MEFEEAWIQAFASSESISNLAIQVQRSKFFSMQKAVVELEKLEESLQKMIQLHPVNRASSFQKELSRLENELFDNETSEHQTFLWKQQKERGELTHEQVLAFHQHVREELQRAQEALPLDALSFAEFLSPKFLQLPPFVGNISTLSAWQTKVQEIQKNSDLFWMILIRTMHAHPL